MICPPNINGVACIKRAGRTVSPGVCARCNAALPTCEGPAHADWCERYGLPTDPPQCAECSSRRAAGDAEYLQAMRARGLAYGAAACVHREPTGQTVDRRCCGGQVKGIPVYRCARTGTTPAPCAGCREKLMSNS